MSKTRWRHGQESDDRDNTSTDSDSSSTERLRWRNHPQIISPSNERSNPFEGLDQRLNKTADPANGSGNLEKEKENGVDGIDGDNGVGTNSEETAKDNLSFRERIRHFTWTWFTMTMATGGIANVLYTVPFRFHGLYALGCIFFILNMVLFTFNVTMISLRFYFYPRTFKSSFLHPTESLFIPAAVISFGTILINITQYGVDTTGAWLETTMTVMFWIDCGLAFGVSIGIYLIMWSTQHFTIAQMSPAWIFPGYSLLIIGPHAGALAPKISDPIKALNIVLAGYVLQGIGFMVSLMIYSAFLYRLMTQKLPKESLRPAMFISVGPSGFTVAGIINMGQELPNIVPKDFMGEGMGEFAGKVSMVCANWMGLWLWGLALWFFFVSVGAHWSCAARGKMDFAMTWYSFVFPNTALTTATFAIAKALNGNSPIRYVGCAMTVLLIVVWVMVVGMMIRAVVLKQILWPQKQEDRTEGGWKSPSIEEQQRGSREGVEEDGLGLGKIRSLKQTISRRRTRERAESKAAARS
ncbi:hypothetical protein K504DRAFT_372809 [Pleomassaria siparia CBS 279.74]|uniref:C4-dicarboxylate/malic acid transporter n=1 Tax=Pleomassaria siparia CBS 279.74 TaxID=1314801 RepID=A0A6G1KIE3_9PLEO|nr:hypothetical protein K504DRAFT_372809 [Pleomassaria siparia CBS 279.74]